MLERPIQTTFLQDFTIADMFGEKWILDTYKTAFDGWKNNVQYFTEFVVALNWKLWEHYDNGNEELAKVYDKLWRQADLYACENFKWEDADYYYRETD